MTRTDLSGMTWTIITVDPEKTNLENINIDPALLSLFNPPAGMIQFTATGWRVRRNASVLSNFASYIYKYLIFVISTCYKLFIITKG
ncbi:MAG: hypothetical protein DSY90_11150 [Deltaproteobacteria bacterium]|nr:MAG: hypothetical protein DSY90_11150 [Deltaproteobacteria bacterium]